MVFFEGVDVRHPLTVINSKFSQPFLNFPNRFTMKKRHKTGYERADLLAKQASKKKKTLI